jgi:hypothetical protein
MIRPLHPCSPDCPGWKVSRVLGMPIVRRCHECWKRELLSPGPTYYQRQPACLAALANQETTNEANERENPRRNG